MPTKRRPFDCAVEWRGERKKFDHDADSPSKAAVLVAEALVGKAPDLNGKHALDVTVEEPGKEAVVYRVTRWPGAQLWKAERLKKVEEADEV